MNLRLTKSEVIDDKDNRIAELEARLEIEIAKNKGLLKECKRLHEEIEELEGLDKQCHRRDKITQ